jgi:hypothetical protein
MNFIDLYNEININSTDWDVNISSKINENDTITITAPNYHYLFELSQDTKNPDIIYGGIYVNDDTHEVIENDYCYVGEGETVETVAEDIMCDIQTDMVDYDA